jgi:hypothetical protein
MVIDFRPLDDLAELSNCFRPVGLGSHRRQVAQRTCSYAEVAKKRKALE